MKNLKEKQEKILQKLLSSKFSDLNEKKVKIIKVKWYFSAYAFSFPTPIIKLIGLTDKSNKLSEKALTGLLAHELNHLSRYYKMNFLEKFNLLFYYFSKKTFYTEERENELSVVRKGYAKELFALKEELSKSKTKCQIEKHSKRGYLSMEEIKSYAKSIGRW